MTQTRRYGGATGDERRKERRERLVEAGFELLVSDLGPRAFTVRGVCREAGLASRYFYENFENPDELAAAIFDEHVIALVTATLEAIEGIEEGDVAGLARESLRVFIGYIAADQRRGRLMFSPALEVVPAIEDRRERSTRLFVGLALDEITQRLAVEDGPFAAIGAEIIIGGLSQAVRVWLDGGVEMSQEEFIAACTQVFTAVGAELTRERQKAS